MKDKKEWLQNQAEKISLDITGHEFDTLGPHLQLMCYMKAEIDYVDYYSSLTDSIYEHEKYRRLMG